MSTNIKLLIALLLGAAIGGLVMKKMSPDGPLANPTDETEYGITSPITWDAAKEMVQHPIVDSLNASQQLYTISSDGTKHAIESWTVEKNALLDFLGIRNGVNYHPEVTGVKFYIAYNTDRTAEGFTLVTVPVDSRYNNIKRPSPLPSNGNFAAALEYHMPCPKNCGANNQPNELSSESVQNRRPK